MTILNRRTLVINKNYQPITTITLKKAIILLSKEVATVVCPPVGIMPWQEYKWEDWVVLDPQENEDSIKSARKDLRIPEIIKLQDYGGLPQRKLKLSRRAVYSRDDHHCQYCGNTPDYNEFTLDHIVPKCRGGQTHWLNVVLSCSRCNRIKGDKPLEKSGLKLLKKPHVPEYDVLQGRTLQYKSWTHFL